MALVLSVLMLGMVALVVGAFVLWRKGGSFKQVGLMLVLAAIMAINVAIWTLPDASGNAPLGQVLQEQPPAEAGAGF